MDNNELITTIEDLTESNRNLNGKMKELIMSNDQLQANINSLEESIKRLIKSMNTR